VLVKTRWLFEVLLMLFVGFCCGGPCCCLAGIPVFDHALTALEQTNWALDHTLKSTFHSADIAKYVEQIENQVRQIVNQYTQIGHQVESLRRLGDPNYYVHMLSLDTLLRPVNFNQDSFRKYGMVFDLYDAYDREMQRYQDTMTKLQNDFASTLEQLNNEQTQIGRETLVGKLQAIATQMDVTKNRIQIAADRVKVQGQVNAADQARMQEALRQMELQTMAAQDQATIEGGVQSQNSFPKVSTFGGLNLGW